MVRTHPSRALELTFVAIALVLLASVPALAQQGSVLTEAIVAFVRGAGTRIEGPKALTATASL